MMIVDSTELELLLSPLLSETWKTDRYAELFSDCEPDRCLLLTVILINIDSPLIWHQCPSLHDYARR